MLSLLCSLALAAPSTADEAVSAALAHPDLAAAAATREARAESAEVAGAWMDPMLAVELSNAALAPVGLTHPMSGVQLKLSQTLSWTSGVRRDAALAQIEVAAAREQVAQVAIERGVRVAWARAGAARAMAELTRDHQARIEEIRAVATKHYEVGKGGQSALLRLRVLEQRLGEEAAEWDREARGWEDALAELTGEAVVVATRPEVVPVAEAALAHPELAALEAEEAAVRADATRLAREGLPAPTVWAGYRLRTAATDGADLATLGISAPIPLSSGRRSSGLADARTAEAEAVAARHDAAERRLTRELETSLDRWQRAVERAATYGEGLVPEAETARVATLTDYTVGRAAFADVLEAEVALLELERVAVQAAAETQVQAAIVTSLTAERLR